MICEYISTLQPPKVSSLEIAIEAQHYALNSISHANNAAKKHQLRASYFDAHHIGAFILKASFAE